ncbi:MAG: hypothetical protein GX786_01330 [Clostridiales bacterium]|nr:hypothetical protein [Clostridiales bacterium]
MKKIEKLPHEKEFLFYEKYILILLEMGEREKANRLFTEIAEKISHQTISADFKYEYTFLAYACTHENYKKDKEFARHLKKAYVYNQKTGNKYTRVLFLRNMLINCYRSQSQYKKMWSLINFPENKVFN